VSERVIVVAKRSVFSQALNGEGDPRVRELLKKDDPSVRKWLSAHDQHNKTLDAVLDALAALGVVPLVLRGAHAAFDPSGAKLVAAVGGDGTLLAASHSVVDVPILGVNSSPRHSVGFFCAARRSGIRQTLGRALEGHMPSVRLTRMTVRHNGQLRSQRVLNDALYCHQSPAATSRYILRHGRAQEEQRSSGFWVGPAAGSTAAQHSAGGKVLPLTSSKLQLVVREPYVPKSGRVKLTRLEVSSRGHITVQSKMQQAGIYLDGPYLTIPVRLGDITTFEVSDQPLTVLGLSRNRERAAV
jgi:NAD+ kinase